ncbi:MAG: mechanosensitive ion channel family protein [Nannocystaceae bacterium]|nr:mechanosensitive ion channel family protein [Nannocystaceae bacterium]
MSAVLAAVVVPSWVPTWLLNPSLLGVGALAVTIVAAYATEFVIRRVLLRLAARTHTDLDDRLIELLRRPIFLSVMFGGMGWAISVMEISATPERLAFGFLQSLAVVVWATAIFRIGALVLTALSGRENYGFVSPPTLPAFLIILRVTLIAGALYFAFLAWNIDLTAWLASAGIIGIAVGFAAKDTLANLFAGVFIIADAPYKVGDWIVIDGSLRGRVVRIGIRSTRMVTRDDVEITIPNAIIGNAKVVNEDGGPLAPHRVRIYVSVAYGSDVDQVVEVLLTCAVGVDNVCETPKPETRFRSFGDSGLNFELMVWCDDSGRRGKLISNLTTKVYKAFSAEGIVIPFKQLDLHIKSDAGGRDSRLRAP